MTDNNTRTIPNAMPVGRDQVEAMLEIERAMRQEADGIALKQTANNRKLNKGK